nr:MAG TPA: Membrane fusion protein p14 fusion protein transmembrane domain [Caudoviricetes sp.]
MKDKTDKTLAKIERVLCLLTAILFGITAFAQIFISHTDITVTLIFCFMLAVGFWAFKNKNK